jgi:hypothetical protein
MDRFVRGFIVGVIAGIVKNAVNLFAYYVLHTTRLLYADYMCLLLLEHKVKTDYCSPH